MKKDFDINDVKKQQPDETTGQFTIIIGQPGVGKSTMASTYPKPFMLDLEGTAGNIKGIKRERILPGKGLAGLRKDSEIPSVSKDLAAKDLVMVRDQFLASDNYETLILDGGLEFVDFIAGYTLQKLGRSSLREHKYGDTYADMRHNVMEFLKASIGQGKNIVLICHIDEHTKIDESTDEEYVVERPLVGDKRLVYKIPAIANIVGKVEVDGDGNRTFNCVATHRNILKNQFGITEQIPATYKALEEKIKKYFKGDDK